MAGFRLWKNGAKPEENTQKTRHINGNYLGECLAKTPWCCKFMCFEIIELKIVINRPDLFLTLRPPHLLCSQKVLMVLPPLELFSLRKELPCCRAALSVFEAVCDRVSKPTSPTPISSPQARYSQQFSFRRMADVGASIRSLNSRDRAHGGRR